MRAEGLAGSTPPAGLVAGGVSIVAESNLSRSETKQAYAQFLGNYNWDYFLTVTFRKERREPYYAGKTVWTHLESKHVATRAFLGIEPHKSGALHVHGLVAFDKHIDIDLPWDIKSTLRQRYGFSTCEAINGHAAVSAYCAKYILKEDGAMDHYGMYGEPLYWRRGRLPETLGG